MMAPLLFKWYFDPLYPHQLKKEENVVRVGHPREICSLIMRPAHIFQVGNIYFFTILFCI